MRDGGVRPGRRGTSRTGQTPDALDRPVATTAEQNGVAHAHTRPTAAANQSSLPGRSRACANSSCAPARALTRQIVTFGPRRPPSLADRLDRAFRVKNARARSPVHTAGVAYEDAYDAVLGEKKIQKKKTDYSDTIFDTTRKTHSVRFASDTKYTLRRVIHCKCKMYMVGCRHASNTVFILFFREATRDLGTPVGSGRLLAEISRGIPEKRCERKIT